MVDNSWDNTDSPVRSRKGMPTWGKVALGCGITFLLGMATCVGGLVFVVHKSTGVLDEMWGRLHAEMATLATTEGARKIYRENPGLADRYPTEEEFLQAAERWRGKLEGFPAKRPEFSKMIKHKRDFSLHTQIENGRKVQVLKLRLENGALLRVEFENERLLDITVD